MQHRTSSGTSVPPVGDCVACFEQIQCLALKTLHAGPVVLVLLNLTLKGVQILKQMFGG